MNRRRSARLAHLVVLTICVSAGACSPGEDAKTTGTTALATPAATTTAAPVATAEPIAPTAAAETHALPPSSSWQVGDVVTIVLEKTLSAKVRSPQDEADALPAPNEKVAATLVEKRTKVDADGVPTESVMYVREWARQSGDVRDDSLKGAVVTVTATAAKPEWSIVRQQKEPTEGARRWLDEQVRSNLAEDQLLAIVAPKKRVAVGERWPVDIERLTEMLARAGVPGSQFKSSGTATLHAVRGDVAEYGLDATLALLSVPGNTRMNWISGGTMELDSSFAVPMRGRLRLPSTASITTTIEGVAQDDEREFRYDFQAVEKRSTTLGGEIPSS